MDFISLRPLNDLAVYIERLVEKRLWLKVLIGLFLGILLGIALNPSTGWVKPEVSSQIATWLDLPGQIFMKLVQMIMIPLIFTSILSGIVGNVQSGLKEAGLKLFIYFIATTTLSIVIGTFVALWLKPGNYIADLGGFSGDGSVPEKMEGQSGLMQNLPQAISNLIPANPLQSILSGEMLSIVIFTLIIGIALTQLERKTAKPIFLFSEAVQKICMVVVSWAMRLVPYAVFGLVAALLSKIGWEVLIALGYYIMVVILGLLILLASYLLILFAFTRRNPFTYFSKMKDAQLLAFSTASSAAVMPLSMKTADEELGVRSSVSDFIIPLGATINMDGTALFQCVTTIFMAQAYGIDLSMAHILLLTVTVVGASIGTPAIPGGGVIILSSVLGSVGIHADGLLVIIGIDRILGMFRTAVNVTGDLTACVVFNELIPISTQEKEEQNE